MSNPIDFKIVKLSVSSRMHSGACYLAATSQGIIIIKITIKFSGIASLVGRYLVVLYLELP